MKLMRFRVEISMLVPNETDARTACFKDFVSFKDVPIEGRAKVIECETVAAFDQVETETA